MIIEQLSYQKFAPDLARLAEHLYEHWERTAVGPHQFRKVYLCLSDPIAERQGYSGSGKK